MKIIYSNGLLFPINKLIKAVIRRDIMQAKTMEGLLGARNNINIAYVPVRVYKDAEHRVDTATMERAAGYAGKFTGRAEEYKSKADKGMAEEAKEARKEEKARREDAVERRREERRKIQERIDESREVTADNREISGKEALLPEDMGQHGTGKEAVIYTKTGEAAQTGEGMGISLYV